MRASTIARNYAEVLLELAKRAGEPPAWGEMIRDVANAVEKDDRLRLFLDTPRIPAARKSEIMAAAFSDRYPQIFVRFLQSLVSHRRQMLIPEIAVEYQLLLDDLEGRVRADVTVSRTVGDEETQWLSRQLTHTMGKGKTVVPNVRINPAILGGVVVRIGDTILDGSVRTRLSNLRRRLIASGQR